MVVGIEKDQEPPLALLDAGVPRRRRPGIGLSNGTGVAMPLHDGRDLHWRAVVDDEHLVVDHRLAVDGSQCLVEQLRLDTGRDATRHDDRYRRSGLHTGPTCMVRANERRDWGQVLGVLGSSLTSRRPRGSIPSSPAAQEPAAAFLKRRSHNHATRTPHPLHW
jgi:hypothetical protein